MNDWTYNLDKTISNMSQTRRIIYFKSENRNIIEEAINHSSALRAKLKLSAHDSENLFRKLTMSHKCISLTSIYKAGGVIGTLNLPDYVKKETNEKYKIIPHVVILTDFQIFNEQDRGRMVKAFLDSDDMKETMFLISSPEVLIPDGFSNEIELISDMYITQNDIYEKLRFRVREEEAFRKKQLFTDDQLKRYATDFVGLTAKQVDDILDAMDKQLCTGLLPVQAGGKTKASPVRELIKQERIKEAEKDSAIRFIELDKEERVAGLGGYTNWLWDRADDFSDPVEAKKCGTPAPKGVLLCGIPGTGKTAMARETARNYEVPLIQFDISRIQSSKLGESEARLSRYLDRISAFGSCVMLMDEVEKTFSVNDSTHEVKLAMLGQLLDWMQSRKANVLTFITANNISKLPAELLRDGRISGRFFAFMPSRNDLAAIMRLKLAPLTHSNMINSEFRDLIEKVPTSDKECNQDALAEILDQIAIDAKRKKERGEIRWPFMTGANMEVLIEMTNRALRKKEKIKNSGVSKPYSFHLYKKQMCECAASTEFVPQGQSNMKDIVDMWINAQERQYQDVSAHTLLPFSKFKDGKFTQELTADNAYDQFLIETLQSEIESACKKTKEQESALKKYAVEQKTVS